MKKLTKIGGHVLAIALCAALVVVNVQVGINGSKSDSAAVELSAGIEKAYADGPCDWIGCAGGEDKCFEVGINVWGIEISAKCFQPKDESTGGDSEEEIVEGDQDPQLTG